MISYTDSLFWKKDTPFLTADPVSFVKRLEKKQPTYEVTGTTDNVCRIYFDIDYKGDDQPWKYDLIEKEATKYINQTIAHLNNIEPEITVQTSHGFTATNEWKISFRFWVNLKAKKSTMGSFIKTMNHFITCDATHPLFVGILEEMGNKLFDEGIYDHNRKIRCLGTSKPNENRPLIMKSGNICDTVITGFLDDLIVLDYEPAEPETKSTKSDKKSTKSDKKSTKTDDLDQTLSVSLLQKISQCYSATRIDDYSTWTQLGWAIVNVFGKTKEVETVFVNLNERVPSRNNALQKSEAKEWFQYKCERREKTNSDNLGIGSLISWAKQDNKTLYDELFEIKQKPLPRKIYYPIEDKFFENKKCDEMEFPECSTGVVADTFVKMYSDKFICVDDVAYLYTGIYWEKQNGLQACIHRFIDEEAMKEWDVWYENQVECLNRRLQQAMEFEDNSKEKWCKDYINKYEKFHKALLRMVRNITNRKPLVVEIMIKSTRVIEMNKNPFLFAFQNKVFDLSKYEFVEPDPKDYLTCSCGWSWDDEYDTTSQVKKINDVIDTIFPDKAIRAFYLECLSTGLYGQLVEHLFISTGTGGNGKSLLHGLMLSCVGNYGYVLQSSALLSEIKQGPNPQIANLDDKRFVLTQEPDAKKRINTATMKDLTGNTTLNVRDIYSSKSKITLRMSLFLEANTLPLLDKIDGDSAQALVRRLVATPYVSSFVNQDVYDSIDDKTNIFVGDSSLKCDTFQINHRQALFIILVEQFQNYMKNKGAISAMPAPCKEILKKYYMMSDDFLGWFNDSYEKDENAVVYISDLFDDYKCSSFYADLPKTEKRKITKTSFDEQIQKNMFLRTAYKPRDTYFNGIRHKKSFLAGYKMIEIESLPTEPEEEF